MFDDVPGDRFPNAEERAQRRVTLFEELGKFLDDYRDMDGDSWPDLTREEHTALYDIMGEILDLKFARDADGDRSISYDIAPKRAGSFVSFTIPYLSSHSNLLEDSFDDWVEDASRTAALAASYAKSAADNVSNALHHRMSALRNHRKKNEEFAAAVKAIDEATNFKHVHDLMEMLYDMHRDGDRKLLRATQARVAERWPAKLDFAIGTMMKAMDGFTNDNGEGYNDIVRIPYGRFRKTFGPAFYNAKDLERRYNDLYSKGRDERVAARNAKRVAKAPE